MMEPELELLMSAIFDMNQNLKRIADQLELMNKPKVKAPKEPKAPKPLPPPPPIPQNQEIKEDINWELIYQTKEVTKEETLQAIQRIKDWFKQKPDMAKASQWTIRTARVLKFLDQYPNKNENQKTRQASIII
jgi:hypothetical protein